MKKSFAVAAAVAFLVSAPAFAELPSAKQVLTTKPQTLTTPQQQKIKRLPKSAVPVQTGQDTGTEASPNQTAETNTPTPQATANIQIGGINFMPQSPSAPACQKKWVVELTNTGGADSSSTLVMTPTYRKAAGVNEQTFTDTPLEVLPAGRTVGYVGAIPMREYEETELLLNIRDGNTVLASKVFTLPEAVKPSAENVALGEGSVSTAQLSFVVENRGSIDVNTLSYRIRGIPNAGDTVSEHLTAGTIICLSPGENRTITVEIPLAPYHAYSVHLTPSGSSQIFTDKIYNR